MTAARLPLRLAVITDLEGVLEPCGCTSHSAGGLDRLAYALAELRREPAPLFVVAAGDLLFGSSSEVGSSASHLPARPLAQASLQADALVELFAKLEVDLVVPGPIDLAHGREQLRALARGSRRVRLLGAASSVGGVEALAPAHIVRIGDHRLALVTGTISEAQGVEPRPVSARSHGGSRPQGDIVVGFMHGEDPRPRSGKRTPVADVWILSGGASRHGGGVVVEHGAIEVSGSRHGEELLVIELWPAGEPGSAWQLAADPSERAVHNVVRTFRRRLDDAVPRDRAVRRLLEQSFARVNALNQALARSNDGGGSSTGEPESWPTHPSYAGARTCAACHTAAFLWWQASPHARAFELLAARGRELDLDCIGCHVTGFREPGGARIGRLDELAGVGCESCHGPGGAHVDDPKQPQRSIQREPAEAVCTRCHDPAHSDRFDYRQARAALIAPGHGRPAAPPSVTPARGASAAAP